LRAQCSIGEILWFAEKIPSGSALALVALHEHAETVSEPVGGPLDKLTIITTLR
jgi:hypothetical protein